MKADTGILVAATQVQDGKNVHSIAQLVNAYLMNIAAAKRCPETGRDRFEHQAVLIEKQLRKMIAQGKLAQL